MLLRYVHSLVILLLQSNNTYKDNSSKGIIHDFGSSRYVIRGSMMYGSPYKYYKLDVDQIEANEWDKAIEKADKKYNRKDYNIYG